MSAPSFEDLNLSLSLSFLNIFIPVSHYLFFHTKHQTSKGAFSTPPHSDSGFQGPLPLTFLSLDQPVNTETGFSFALVKQKHT